MNNESRLTIDPALEARIVALVMGEASDFERDELEQLISSRPDLAAYEAEVQELHRLLTVVGAEEPKPDGDWQLPSDRRRHVLGVFNDQIDPDEAFEPDHVVSKSSKFHVDRVWLRRIVSVAAALLVCVAIGSSLFPSLSSSVGLRQAEHDQVAAMIVTAEESDSKSSEYFDPQDEATLYDAEFSSNDQPAFGAIASVDDFESAESSGEKKALHDLNKNLSKGFDSFAAEDGASDDSAQLEFMPPEEPRLGTRLALPSPTKPSFEDSPKDSLQVPSSGTIMLGGITRGSSMEPDGGNGQSAANELSAPVITREYAGSDMILNVTPRIVIEEDEESPLNGSIATGGQNGVGGFGGGAAYGIPGDANADVGLLDESKSMGDGASESPSLADATRGVWGASGAADGSGIQSGQGLDQSLSRGERKAAEDVMKNLKALKSGGQESGMGAEMGGEVMRLKSLDRYGELQELSDKIADQREGKGLVEKQKAKSRSNRRFTEELESGFMAREKYAAELGEDHPAFIALDKKLSAAKGKAESKPRSERESLKAERPAKWREPVGGLNEKSAERESFSTFSLHVSDVSFKLAQAALMSGRWPEQSKVRIEEFVNAFDYGDPLPVGGERVACRVEQSIHPFLQQRNMLRVAMRTAATGRASNTPLRLTFLLDNSGSMERMDRQQTVRRAFALLAQQLQPNDRVTLISFARQPRLLADKVSGSRAKELVQVIDRLPSEGGTNIEAALNLAFEKAREQIDETAQNRIVLLTDGAVNLGDADPESLSQIVAGMRDSGIAFDAAGIIADGLNDTVLEALTRKGDGRYYLLDSADSADDSFVRQIAGALRPSAKNVKVQVEFNPLRVGQYKLLGFEKHRLKTEDFRNDQVDAAEMAAAEAGVALYQIEAKPNGEGDIGTVSVRFRDLSTGQMVEERWPIPYLEAPPRPQQSSASMRIAMLSGLLAAKLRGETLGGFVDLKRLSELANSLPQRTRNKKRVAQLESMIQQARQLAGAQ